MKRTLSLFALLLTLAWLPLAAQLQTPVKFATSQKRVSPTEIDLVFTATINAGWHVYSTGLGDGGPTSATFATDAIEGAELVGTLKAGPGYFDMFCEGDTDSVSLHLDGASVEVDSDSEVCSMFPLDYFSNIIKAIPAGTTVMVELDNDYPVKLVFSLADGNARVNYLLAPRIESE